MQTPLVGRGLPAPVASLHQPSRRDLLALLAAGPLAGLAAPALAAAQGTLTWGVHISLAPTWFDPAGTPGIITPFLVLYALHDAVLKPMPGNPLAPSLAESWSVSEDGLVYIFQLRDNASFHNGEPVTPEDVKFSFERYRGTAHEITSQRVAAVEVMDKHRVRFTLRQPWPDFLTFYGSATGAGWIVPKKYVEQVGDDAYKKAPIGAGPYKFVSFNPGVELVMEAHEAYWRKPPSIKRLVFRVIPEEATRLAALKRGEIDIAYSIRGELAEELQRMPGLTIKPAVVQGTFWLYFPDQWDPKSPWSDRRVRQAASLALDRAAMNQALTLGYSRVTNSTIPDMFDFYWQPPPAVYDPGKAKRLLAEAGLPNGFDAGDYYCDSSYSNIGEAALDYLRAAGIRAKLRPLERAAFIKANAEKQLKNIIQGASGAFGNAATRLESFVVKDGTFVYGNEPDIDELFHRQSTELDPKKRAAMLQQLQQMVHEKAIFAPIWQLAFINAVGPRVGESGFGLIKGHPYSSPYEDLTLK